MVCGIQQTYETDSLDQYKTYGMFSAMLKINSRKTTWSIGLVAALIAATLAVIGAPSQPVSASVSLSTPSQPRRISGGNGFMCMETLNAVYCAGHNDKGQLGDSTNTDRNYLKQIDSGSKIMNVQMIAAGASHACAISGTNSTPAAGKLYCWGDNQYGQLGDGTTTNRSTPTLVADNGAFVNADVQGVIAGDNHTCAITTISSVKRLFCWGRNNKGQLGDGTINNSSVPIAPGAPFATGAVLSGNWYYMPGLAAGGEHTCASSEATSPSKVYCWGANESGQLGDGTTTDRTSPVYTGEAGPSGSNSYHANIAAGKDFSCLLGSTTIKCWGNNSKNQMGNGNTTNVLTPTAVPTNGSFTNGSVQYLSLIHI